MKNHMLRLVPFALAFTLAFPLAAATAGSVVTVELWDNMTGGEMPTDFKYGTPNLDLAKAPMGMKLSPDTAAAGPVTFNVTNVSKTTVHEMIVMYRADASAPLPYLNDENRVDEDKAGDKGEVSELDAGKSGSLTVDLAPGKYVLICNVPGHYAAGMWATFTVTK